MTETDDSDRLIQEVLSELGWDDDPKKVADKVKRLDQGLPAEDEFTAICSWLGKARLLHKLDQHQRTEFMMRGGQPTRGDGTLHCSVHNVKKLHREMIYRRVEADTG